jgi:hypothetical protein
MCMIGAYSCKLSGTIYIHDKGNLRVALARTSIQHVYCTLLVVELGWRSESNFFSSKVSCNDSISGLEFNHEHP